MLKGLINVGEQRRGEFVAVVGEQAAASSNVVRK
jgi:hypothetical protein